MKTTNSGSDFASGGALAAILFTTVMVAVYAALAYVGYRAAVAVYVWLSGYAAAVACMESEPEYLDDDSDADDDADDDGSAAE